MRMAFVTSSTPLLTHRNIARGSEVHKARGQDDLIMKKQYHGDSRRDATVVVICLTIGSQ